MLYLYSSYPVALFVPTACFEARISAEIAHIAHPGQAIFVGTIVADILQLRTKIQ